MSALARRGRDEQFERQRELVAMRAAVVAATTAHAPAAGSSATLDAVDEALAELVAMGAHLVAAEQVKGLWIRAARCRLLDELGSAHARRHDLIAVDDHTTALEVSASDDPGALRDEERESWRVREILSVLRGEQRTWAQAWYREVLSGSLAPGAQPRGLQEVLGWGTAKTEKTAQRARRKMAEFVMQRQAGLVCSEQRALLDAFITATRGTPTEDLDRERYDAVLLHIVGCEDCFATWHVRRRSALSRPLAVLMLPIDAIVGAAQAFASRVAAAATAVASSVLGRLGMGGAAAAGGGVATIGAKATAVCVGVVCAATAGGEIANVLPPILPTRAPVTRTQDAPAAPAAGPTQSAAVTAPPVTAVTAPPATTPATSPASTTTQPAGSSTTAPPAQAPTAPVTPGDLPAASSATSPPPAPSRSSTPPPAPAAHHATSSKSPSSCVPGTLGC